MASDRNGTLYIGVTNSLSRRNFEHKNKAFKSFSSRYKINRLVYCEAHDDVTTAITREKAMKKWNRAWKIELIEKSNPEWDDLFPA
jgi:putative endonuclease